MLLAIKDCADFSVEWQSYALQLTLVFVSEFEAYCWDLNFAVRKLCIDTVEVTGGACGL